jgi:hypothetical protein
MQLDASSRLRQPLLHENGMVIARIVEKDVDRRQQGVIAESVPKPTLRIQAFEPAWIAR